MFTPRFWIQAGERALKTAAQVPLTVWGTLDLGLDVLAVDWRMIGSLAAGGALISLLTSIASAPLSDGSTPSLVR